MSRKGKWLPKIYQGWPNAGWKTDTAYYLGRICVAQCTVNMVVAPYNQTSLRKNLRTYIFANCLCRLRLRREYTVCISCWYNSRKWWNVWLFGHIMICRLVFYISYPNQHFWNFILSLLLLDWQCSVPYFYAFLGHWRRSMILIWFPVVPVATSTLTIVPLGQDAIRQWPTATRCPVLQ